MKIILSFLLAINFGMLHANENIHFDKVSIDLTDQNSLQRGARTFINYCLNCHSAAYMRYNRLIDIGLSEQMIEDNLLFTADKVGDLMTVAMSTTNSKEWFGVTPPDLSVVARSRGSDWIYSYMRGFYRDKSREVGWNNSVLLNSAMPHVLWELQGEQEIDHKTNRLFLHKSGKLTVKEYDALIADLTNYMAFMSEPDQLKRKRMGFYVVGFLFLLLFLSINLKKEFWRDIK